MTDKKPSLHAQVRHAGLWVAIRQITVRGLSILQLLLLARILTPADFGMFAIAMMVYAFIEAMTFLGFGHALIQRKAVDSIHLNTLFIVNIARGMMLGLMVFGLSGPVSYLMNSTESQSLIAGIGLLPVIMGFQNPAMILFQKELRMKQELVFYLAGALANLSVSLTLALQGNGPWSLIMGLIAQALSQLAVSYLIQSYRPNFQFSKASFIEMFDFGKWLMASQGMKYFSNNLPLWVIGHYLGVQPLGLYHIAGRFSQAIGNEFSALIATVAFPTFSKMQDNKARLAAAYLRSQKIVLSASFLLFGSMIVFSEPFVNIFLGKEWVGVESLIALLAMLGMVQSIGAQAEIMKALNMSVVIAKLSFIRLVLVSGLIVFFTRTWGTEGAVIAILLPAVILLLPAISIILRKLDINSSDFVIQTVPPILAFASISLIPLVLEMSYLTNVLQLLSIFVMIVFFYGVVLLSFDILFGTGIFVEWRRLLSRSNSISAR